MKPEWWSALQGGALNLSAQSLSGASPLDDLFATAADGTLLESGLDLGGGNTVSAIKVSGEVDKDLLNGKNGPGNLFEGQIAGEAVLAVAGLQVAAGDSLLIKGPSGSGKSTLFRALAGIWPWARTRVQRPADFDARAQALAVGQC